MSRFSKTDPQFQQKIKSFGPIWYHATRTSIFATFRTLGKKIHSSGQLREMGFVPLTGENKGFYGIGPNQNRISGYTTPDKLYDDFATYTQYMRDFSKKNIIKAAQNILTDFDNAPESIRDFILIMNRFYYFLKPKQIRKVQEVYLKNYEQAYIDKYLKDENQYIQFIKEFINSDLNKTKEEWKQILKQKGINITLRPLDLSDFKVEKFFNLLKKNNFFNILDRQNIANVLIDFKVDNPTEFKSNRDLIFKAFEEFSNGQQKATKAFMNIFHNLPVINYNQEEQQIILDSKPIILGFNDPKLLSQLTNLDRYNVNASTAIGEVLIPSPIDLKKYLKFVIVSCRDINYVNDLLKQFGFSDVDVLCDIYITCKGEFD